MHLPGPLRAAVGLVATAADEVKSLPDRAVELPMLAVSTALQVSLRAQQRYAQLAARGERVLNREEPGEEPPAWATFDEPVSADDLRRTALTQLDSLIDGTLTGEPDGPDSDAGNSGWDITPADTAARSAGRMFEQLFGVSDPAAGGAGPGSAPDDGADAIAADADANADDRTGTAGEPDTGAVVVPITQGAAAKRAARKSPRKSSRKSPAKKAAAAKHTPAATTAEDTPPATKSAAKSATKEAAAKKAPARKAPAKKASADPALDAGGAAGNSTPPAGKPVNKPRHTAPSKFDDVDG